jgi:hypothetical protein
MQQVGKRTDFLLRLIDRRIDIVAESLCAAVTAYRAPQAQYIQAGGNQMLARRIMKIRCNPLLYFFFKRQQSDAEIRCGSSCESALDSAGRGLIHSRVATNYPDAAAALRTSDRSDDRLKVSWASAERKAMPVTNRSSLSKACFAGSRNGFRVFVTHAVRNCFFADIFG